MSNVFQKLENIISKKNISNHLIIRHVYSGMLILYNLSDAYNEMGPEIQEKIEVIDVIDFIASKI